MLYIMKLFLQTKTDLKYLIKRKKNTLLSLKKNKETVVLQHFLWILLSRSLATGIIRHVTSAVSRKRCLLAEVLTCRINRRLFIF